MTQEGSAKGIAPALDNITTVHPNEIVRKYLLKHTPIFSELMDAQRKGWENPEGDKYFEAQRRRADHADDTTKRGFYTMMCHLGDELHSKTAALRPASVSDGHVSVLDLCMAPGGFTASALKANCSATVCGISLPIQKGGHRLLLPNWRMDPRIRVNFMDITMLAAEMDVVSIPVQHPDANNFSLERPFFGQQFDLVFCDGQVLRTHARAEYREMREAWRLLTSQLVLALQRVKKGGTLVILLHKLQMWHTVELLFILSGFSSLQLFKPKKKHAIRSSFYVVASLIEPKNKAFQGALDTWKKEWRTATFGSDAEHAESRVQPEGKVEEVLSEFGPQLVKMGEPIFAVQYRALRKCTFVTQSVSRTPQG